MPRFLAAARPARVRKSHATSSTILYELVGAGPASGSRLTGRLIAQRPSTSIGRPPVVGLVIKTNDGRCLERAIHFALDCAKARIDEAVGDEWFETTPQKIKDWHLAHQQTLGVLRATQSHK